MVDFVQRQTLSSGNARHAANVEAAGDVTKSPQTGIEPCLRVPEPSPLAIRIVPGARHGDRKEFKRNFEFPGDLYN